MNSRQTAPAAAQIIVTAALYPMISRALYAAVSLGVFDLLAEGPRYSAHLAESLSVHSRPLHQMLRAVATTGLLRTTPDGSFALTDEGRFLVNGHPSSSRDFILTAGGPAWHGAMGAVVDTIRTGRSGFEFSARIPASDYYLSHPEEAASFNRVMNASHGIDPYSVTAAYDFSDCHRIVDIGGTLGTLLREILTAAPHASGTLFDLPHAIEAAQQTLGQAASEDRCSFAAGNFFLGVPPGDTYVLAHIVHGWTDEECVKLLGNCRDALEPGGRILVMETILPENDEPHPLKMLDVALAVVVNGAERTQRQYFELFASAGLRLTRIFPTSSGVSIMELTSA